MDQFLNSCSTSCTHIITTSSSLPLHDQSDVVSVTRGDDLFAPKILVGEGTISYPFPANSPFLYITRQFVGKVYYETDCPSQQPSMSMVPSTSPTVVESYSPSESPTLSFPPSAVPTSMDSEVPSSAPSAAYVEEVRSGLVLSLGLDECTYDENGKPTELSEEEKSGVAATVQKTAAADAAAKDVTNVQVEVTGVGVVGCRRRLSGDDRRLPTASSAIDFSMVITGEYRPIRRPGSSGPPPPASMDLGAIAEDSINRDPDKFVKDLQARAPADSALNQAAGVEVQAVEAPPKGAPAVMLTRRPTLSPTEPVVAMIIIEEGEEKSSVLLICIVIVGGTIVLLLAFLLFRHAERKAAKKRRKKLERARSEKESDALAKLENDKNAWQLAYNGSDIKQVVHPGAHNMRYSDGAPPHHQYPPPPMVSEGTNRLHQPSANTGASTCRSSSLEELGNTNPVATQNRSVLPNSKLLLPAKAGKDEYSFLSSCLRKRHVDGSPAPTRRHITCKPVLYHQDMPQQRLVRVL
eukprot:scaffold706_cov190-Alexandrium_tamarense.AAC.16